MRRASALALVVSGTVICGILVGAPRSAQARPQRASLAAKPTVWAQIASPHEAEVSHILTLVSHHYAGALSGYIDDYEEDLTEKERQRLLRDLYGMIRYAAERAPKRADIQLWLGRLADEVGDRETAVTAFEQYLATTTKDRLEPGAVGRLGRNLFILGRTREGIATLRRAVAVNEEHDDQRSLAVFDLAQAHMLDGALPLAIDLLLASLSPNGFVANVDLRLSLALAIAFDRDEQISRAHEQLSGISASLGGEDLIALVQQRLPAGGFLSPIDYLYYQAMMLELGDALAEARDVWLAYAQAPVESAPYRARALAHVRAIDRLLREKPAAPEVVAPRRGRPVP